MYHYTFSITYIFVDYAGVEQKRRRRVTRTADSEHEARRKVVQNFLAQSRWVDFLILEATNEPSRECDLGGES